MNVLYPKLRPAWLPAMLGYAVVGAVLAGCYGILHDQITYSISEEYFTRLKFSQFRWANLGLPPRAFVAEIGFLATWWVGLFAAWFLARVTVPAFPPRVARRHTLRGFLIVAAFALASFVVGYFLGAWRAFASDLSGWEEARSALGIVDLPHFVHVAYIHNAGYLGGLIGLIAAILHLRRLRPRNQHSRLGRIGSASALRPPLPLKPEGLGYESPGQRPGNRGRETGSSPERA